MRFMVLVKADKNSEAGVLPDKKLLTEMGKYNEELAKAGAARGRRAPAELEGRARAVLRKDADRDRRTLRRDKGADRGILDVSGEVKRRGNRMGQALPQSFPWRGVRDRDSPGV